jgi:DNA-binding transcriptional regulator YdaS (Cro superfamily)
MTPEEMRKFLAFKVQEEGGPSAFAQKLGIDRPSIDQMIRGARPVSEGVASALGYEKRTVYVRPI